MLRVRFYLDYMDPGSFLMDGRLRVLERELELVVERLPWEVVPPPGALLDPTDPSWTGYWESMAAEGAADGLELTRPALVPWTRKAHELGLLAREKGCFDKVHQAVFRAFHMEGRDIGRVDVLVSLGRDAGLDLTETKAVLDIDRLAPDLEAVRAEGKSLGVRGVPSLVLGEQVIEGVHGAPELKTFFSGD